MCSTWLDRPSYYIHSPQQNYILTSTGNLYQTTRPCNPEDNHLRAVGRENMKSYLIKVCGEVTPRCIRRLESLRKRWRTCARLNDATRQRQPFLYSWEPKILQTSSLSFLVIRLSVLSILIRTLFSKWIRFWIKKPVILFPGESVFYVTLILKFSKSLQRLRL